MENKPCLCNSSCLFLISNCRYIEGLLSKYLTKFWNKIILNDFFHYNTEFKHKTSLMCFENVFLEIKDLFNLNPGTLKFCSFPRNTFGLCWSLYPYSCLCDYITQGRNLLKAQWLLQYLLKEVLLGLNYRI